MEQIGRRNRNQICLRRASSNRDLLSMPSEGMSPDFASARTVEPILRRREPQWMRSPLPRESQQGELSRSLTSQTPLVLWFWFLRPVRPRPVRPLWLQQLLFCCYELSTFNFKALVIDAAGLDPSCGLYTSQSSSA